MTSAPRDPSPLRRGLIGWALAAVPAGSAPIMGALVVHGLATYAFLSLVSRTLEPGAYSSFAVVWGLVLVLGPGLFQPLEQELARSTAARAHTGDGSRPVLGRSLTVGAAAWALAAAAIAAGWAAGLDDLLDRRAALAGILVLSLGAWGAAQLVRGVVAGRSLFAAYAISLLAEAAVRVGLAVVFVAVGWDDVVALTTIVALSLAGGAAIVVALQRPLAHPGTPARWGDVVPRLGWLVALAAAEALLLNIGPVVTDALSSAADEAGRFLNGLVIARVPVLLFQGIKASLLPSLAGALAAGGISRFATEVRRLAVVVLAVTAATTAAAAAVGPAVVDVVFGTSIGHAEMALLAAGNCLSMPAVVVTLGLVALERARAAAAAWGLGVIGFIVALAVPVDPLGRVALALVVAMAAVAGWGTALLSAAVRHRRS